MLEERKKAMLATGLRNAQRRAAYVDQQFREKVWEAADSGLFTRRELAAILDVSATTVQRMVAEKP